MSGIGVHWGNFAGGDCSCVNVVAVLFASSSGGRKWALAVGGVGRPGGRQIGVPGTTAGCGGSG